MLDEMAAPASTPRTLTQMLREWDDDALVRLLLGRPDLARPAPSSMSQLASRATTRQSVAEAVDKLNVFDLWVARRCIAYPDGFTTADVRDDPQGRAALTSLRRLLDLALLWGSAEQMRPVRALATVLGDEPAGVAPPWHPPSFVDVRQADPAIVEQAGAGTAFDLVRRMEVALEYCDQCPPRLRSNGQPSIRDLRVLAGHLDVPQDLARFCLELAASAKLVGVAEQQQDRRIVPTVEFDRWQDASLADQWIALARGWWHRHPSSGPAQVKACLVDAFGEPAEGRVLTREELAAWLRWQLPRAAAQAGRQIGRFVEQAQIVGITALGALTEAGRRLEPDPLSRLLPDRVEHVVVQADLTAVAPGPLTPRAARDLAALADVESRGGATVYRLSMTSLRRAHNQGWQPRHIENRLQRLSRTPLPQPLRYMISDLERQPQSSRRAEPATAPPTGSVVRRFRLPVAEEEESALDPAEAASLAAALRESSDATRPVDLRMPTSGDSVADSPLVALREAVETREVVWFGYVDSRGQTGERIVHAISIDDGRLCARDARSQEALTVPVQRITSAHIIRRGR